MAAKSNFAMKSNDESCKDAPALVLTATSPAVFSAQRYFLHCRKSNNGNRNDPVTKLSFDNNNLSSALPRRSKTIFYAAETASSKSRQRVCSSYYKLSRQCSQVFLLISVCFILALSIAVEHKFIRSFSPVSNQIPCVGPMVVGGVLGGQQHQQPFRYRSPSSDLNQYNPMDNTDVVLAAERGARNWWKPTNSERNTNADPWYLPLSSSNANNLNVIDDLSAGSADADSLLTVFGSRMFANGLSTRYTSGTFVPSNPRLKRQQQAAAGTNGQIEIEPSGAEGHFYVAEQAATVLTCIVRKSPAVVREVKWYFQGAKTAGQGIPVTENGGHIYSQQLVTTGESGAYSNAQVWLLYIKQMRPATEGTYRCEAVVQDPKTNQIIRKAKSIQVHNFQRLSFRNTPTLIKEEAGTVADIKCQAEGSGEIVLQWRKDGVPMPPANDTAGAMVRGQPRIQVASRDGKSQLRIHNVQRNDGGVYQCVGTQIFKEPAIATMDIQLLVKFAPAWSDRIPVAAEHFSWDNNTANLSCGVMSLPEPQFKWFKATRDPGAARASGASGTNNVESSQFQLQELSNSMIRMQPYPTPDTPEGRAYQGPYISSLLVRTNSAQDYGTYICRVENEVTRNQKSVRPLEHRFVLKPAASPPPPVIKVLKVSDTFAILEIVPPQLPETYPQIMQYQVQVQRVGKVTQEGALETANGEAMPADEPGQSDDDGGVSAAPRPMAQMVPNNMNNKQPPSRGREDEDANVAQRTATDVRTMQPRPMDQPPLPQHTQHSGNGAAQQQQQQQQQRAGVSRQQQQQPVDQSSDAAEWQRAKVMMLHAKRPALNEYQLSGLEPGTRYRIRVRARNAVGIGQWSASPYPDLTTQQPQAESTKSELTDAASHTVTNCASLFSLLVMTFILRKISLLSINSFGQV